MERRRRAAEVIVRHVWDEVDVMKDPEGHLLELSTAMALNSMPMTAAKTIVLVGVGGAMK